MSLWDMDYEQKLDQLKFHRNVYIELLEEKIQLTDAEKIRAKILDISPEIFPLLSAEAQQKLLNFE